jgi:hypothetical protein
MNAVDELREFHRFLGAILENGGPHLLPEEVLEEWRELHPEPLDEEDDVAAIQASLDDFDAGVIGMPLEEFDRKLRKKFNLPDPRKQ